MINVNLGHLPGTAAVISDMKSIQVQTQVSIPQTNAIMLWEGLPHYCPDSKVHEANMGPTWDRQDPGGPHVGPMNLAIWVALCEGSPMVIDGFSSQRAGNAERRFSQFVDIDMNKMWNKYFRCQRFENPWCLCDVTSMTVWCDWCNKISKALGNCKLLHVCLLSNVGHIET